MWYIKEIFFSFEMFNNKCFLHCLSKFYMLYFMLRSRAFILCFHKGMGEGHTVFVADTDNIQGPST